jgi:hypothetical protein
VFYPPEPTYESFRQRVLQAIDAAERAGRCAGSGRAAAVAGGRDADGRGARPEPDVPGGNGDNQRIRDRAYQYYLNLAHERLLADDHGSGRRPRRPSLSANEAQGVVQTVRTGAKRQCCSPAGGY